MVNLAVAADDGNGGGGGWGGEAGAPGGGGIACVNCQAVVAAAAVEEEEEEGAVDRDGNRAADGDEGPVVHSDRKGGDKSAAPRTGGWRQGPPRQPWGGIGIILREASWIIVTTARLTATHLAVAAKLGTAAAAAAAAEVAGTETEKNGGGGNTKAEENLHL